MARVLLLLAAAAACGGPGYHPPHGGTCPTDTGCEAPVEPVPRYLPPSEPDATLTTHAPATCASVARVLGSTEVGNYADEDRLRIAAGKWEQSCVKQHLTLAELGCLDDVADRAGVAHCVPRWFPNEARR